MADQTTAPTKGQDAEKAQERTRRPEPAPEHLTGLAGETVLLDALLGGSVADPRAERHAAILGDPRFSHPANAAQRARMVSELQETYGNAHVQRVIEQINANAANVQRKHGIEMPMQMANRATASLLVQRKKGPTPYDKLQDFTRDASKAWMKNQGRFNLAMRRFWRTMSMASEEDAAPDLTGALVKHVIDTVTQKALGQVATLIPGFSEIKGLLDALSNEVARAEKAGEELLLRDYMNDLDTKFTESFEKQQDAITKGREDLWKNWIEPWDEKTQWMIVNSFPNWLGQIKKAIPTWAEYETALHTGWVNLNYGFKRFEIQGIIELKFDAEEPGPPKFQSAQVKGPYAKKTASGLNQMMRNPKSGVSSVFDLRVRKAIGLYCENLVGGTSYHWVFLDENSNVERTALFTSVARQRWATMRWKTELSNIKNVSGG